MSEYSDQDYLDRLIEAAMNSDIATISIPSEEVILASWERVRILIGKGLYDEGELRDSVWIGSNLYQMNNSEKQLMRQ